MPTPGYIACRKNGLISNSCGRETKNTLMCQGAFDSMRRIVYDAKAAQHGRHFSC